ncbi:caveolin-2 [Camelus ferus]|nr:caveolin-2 [Camelus ferus]
MGLETEKADVQLFMDDDSYSHHSGIDYADPEKFADLGTDRDPHRLNSHLKVGFDDVIAEPVSTHSFDKVWICSHALFEISKYVIYKFLTVFLAIPLAFAAGILFATLSCLHIWALISLITFNSVTTCARGKTKAISEQNAIDSIIGKGYQTRLSNAMEELL